MFAYQSTFNVRGLKIDKGVEYIIDWKSKGWTFLPNVKYFGVKIQFNNTPLVIEQINYASKNCKCLHHL